MPRFDSVESHPDFPALEQKMLKWWGERGMVEKYLQKNASSDKRFSFIDGPITANNPMGVNHAWGRTYKDFFQRFKNMQGYAQRFQNGFDCQGLWVEVEVEKDLGFNSKKDIEKFGLAKFTQACQDRVKKFSQVQTEQSQRLGQFMDWDHSYYTYSETNNFYLWHFLKKCQKKGWLYKGTDSVPWCPRCGTAISKHEISDGGYREIEHISLFVEFPIKGRTNEYLLVWTTTPWTLSVNTALAVNPKVTYAKTEGEVAGNVYYLAKSLAEGLGLKVIEDIPAKELIGLEYDSLYPEFSVQQGFEHRVIPWDLVSEDEGTGIVHIAPGAGEEDHDLGKELGLELIAPLDEGGIFGEGFGFLSDRFALDKKVVADIISDLEQKDRLFDIKQITHSYPHCWRCKQELVFRVSDEWYIACDEIRPLMKVEAAKVNWEPEFLGKRMQDWLDNMGDWPISRRRVYGLALPFYECECGELTVVGSKEELRGLAIEPEQADQLPSPHRPWIDAIKIKCPACGKEVSRIPEVGDCWLDAGVVPYSTLKYLDDRDYWEQWFPAELVTEYFPQIKLWFYSMLFISTALEGRTPYQNVFGYAFMLDETGKQMHKSWGNLIEFNEAAEKMGADVVRWLYLSSPNAKDMRFGYGLGEEVRRRFHGILWNSYKFFVTYAGRDGWEPNEDHPSEKDSSHILDRWILARLHSVTKNVTAEIEGFSPMGATQVLQGLVDDFSTWYIRRSRDRTGPEFYRTCYQVLVALVKMLAPFTPFLAEEIYQNLRRDSDPESVHLCDWPEANEGLIDEELLEQMSEMREIVERGHALRKGLGLRVRQPLSSLTTTSGTRFPPEIDEIGRAELNVKSIEHGHPEYKLATTITPELELEGRARDLVREIQKLRKEAGCQLTETVHVSYPDEYREVIEKFGEAICKKALVGEFVPNDALRIVR